MFRKLSPDYLEIQTEGGLGNQLFQLAAAYCQSQRLGVSLHLLPLLNRPGNTPRKLEIAELAVALGAEFSAISRCRRKFTESSSLYDESVNKILPGTRLEGYFQSPRYFEPCSQILCQEIMGLTDFTEGSDSMKDEVFLGLHLRRGDYMVEPFKSFHGVFSNSYYRRSIELLRALTGIEQAVIFSDDEIAAGVLAKEIGKAEVRKGGQSSAFSVLGQLSRARGFVLSNSSFSWWAAFLGDSTYPVICPRPWFKAKPGAELDLVLDTWLQLGETP